MDLALPYKLLTLPTLLSLLTVLTQLHICQHTFLCGFKRPQKRFKNIAHNGLQELCPVRAGGMDGHWLVCCNF